MNRRSPSPFTLSLVGQATRNSCEACVVLHTSLVLIGLHPPSRQERIELERRIAEVTENLSGKFELVNPYPLHPTTYTLHPAPDTLHPAPYTLHLTPYTLRRVSPVPTLPNPHLVRKRKA